MAPTLHVLVEIVSIGSYYACCTENRCLHMQVAQTIYTFQLKELQFAQTMRIPDEIVIVSSDYVHFY